mgnify:CR=1 FL=1
MILVVVVRVVLIVRLILIIFAQAVLQQRPMCVHKLQISVGMDYKEQTNNAMMVIQ